VEIRIIRPEEWTDLKPVFEAENGRIPDPQRATAAIAIDERGLAGFWMLQEMLHAGPLWIREDHRGTRLWRPLNRELLKVLDGSPAGSGFYSFSDGARMDHVFRQLGYNDLKYQVWKREL
jgi:hypothetical protein